MRSVVLILLLLVCPLVVPAASAQSDGAYGVAPTDVPFGGAVRGEPLYRVISIQNDKDQPVGVELRADNETGSWALPDERNLTLAARSTLDLPLRMQVPSDVPNGRYQGSIYVHFVPGANVTPGTSGAKLAFAVRVNLSVEVGGPQVQRLEAGGLHVPDTEESAAFVFHWQIKNSGNVRTAPTALVEVRRADGTPVAQENLTSTPIAPGLTENVTFRLASTLPRGQYVLSASLAPPGDPAQKEEAWFEALEPGALRRSGTLGMLALYDLGTRQQTHRVPFGHGVQLRAPFTNTGELPVKATLQGFVAQEGKLVAEIRSDELLVDPGETVELKVLLPDLPMPGQYLVTAEAAYAGKVTPSQDAVLIIERAPVEADPLPIPWLGGVAGVVALAIFVWIVDARVRRR